MGGTEDQRGQMIGLRLHSKCTKIELSSNLPPRGELRGQPSPRASLLSAEPSLYLHFPQSNPHGQARMEHSTGKKNCLDDPMFCPSWAWH